MQRCQYPLHNLHVMNNVEDIVVFLGLEVLIIPICFPSVEMRNFKGYLCDSDIAIFAYEVTWNYANSPFKFSKYSLNIELRTIYLFS